MMGKKLAAAALAMAGCVVIANGAGSSGSASASSFGPANVKVMWIGDLTGPLQGFPQGLDSATAAVKGINAAGGLGHGRKIVLLSCNSAGDPNQGAVCARQAVAEKVAAVVGGQAVNGGVTPILNGFKIPSIGNNGLGGPDLTSPYTWQVNGSASVANPACGAPMLKALGGKSIGLIILTSAVVNANIDVFKQSVHAAHGLTISSITVAPSVTADLSPVVAAARANNPDLLFVVANTAFDATVIRALRDAGVTTRVLTGDISTQLPTMTSTEQADIYTCNLFRPVQPSFPGSKQIMKDFAAAGDTRPIDFVTVNTWVAVRVFAEVAQKLAKIDAASVQMAMSKSKSVDTLGFTPRLNFTKQLSAFSGQYPRLFNGYVWLGKVENSKVVYVGKNPVNVFANL